MHFIGGALLLFAAAAAAAGAAPAEGDKVALLGQTAVAYGDTGAARFRGALPYLLEVAQNPEGIVKSYDAQRRMARISADGAPGLWLSCAELVPMATACSSTVTATPRQRWPSRGMLSGMLPSAIPACPGDPRCPRLK